MLSLSYLRYLCFFTSTVVISIQRPDIAPLYIQEGVQNDYRMTGVFNTQGLCRLRTSLELGE